MDWESSFCIFLERAIKRLRLEKPAFSLEQAFSTKYRALASPRRAVRDLLRLVAAARNEREIVELRRSTGGGGGSRHEIRIYGVKERALDEFMPLLRNLGLRVIDQVQFDLTLDVGRCFIRNFSIEPIAEGPGSIQTSRKPLLHALGAVLAGDVEDDALNGLSLLLGLAWREIDLLRAYCNYYLQLGAHFERSRVHAALLGNLEVARLLLRYFKARFQPGGQWRDSNQRETEALTPIRQQLIAVLDEVRDIVDDRISRDLFNLIDATLRTNFYCRGDLTEDYIALKIGSLGVINMPNPKPIVEIYVHSRIMEGVHLRGARVARGGIRWSDRLDDFRNEILGLMQTQMIKNALIVPQGAKGGFIIKVACGDFLQRQNMALRAYSTFLRGLLDLTDDAPGSPPARSRQLPTYDDADPYLVIAADKGTASWSDRANEIASEYGFWLGDAFATGGSHGYHHKRLGITARGAWICIKRHFRELSFNIEERALTVVGVGSMDGDVFGNGMLQTSNIRLLGAFDSRHIFLDPNPDPLNSFAERRRLFEAMNSTWQDYNPALISSGGGVFRRNAKDIPLSSEARAWLGTRNRSVDGEGLIRLLLTAPVDLLWMGGVGTYVKASFETDESVGDRVNDGARVDANQLRAKVVGEGANLALTQRGRIEYALNGGYINMDAIDNSAGVDLSDHEVNLKILLGLMSSEGSRGDDEAERDRLFNAVSDDVCGMVLDDNYRQSLCLSLERVRCLKDVGPYLELADQLENTGLLDRRVVAFPPRKEVLARAGRELTRPELGVLTAYSKLTLKRALLDARDFLDAEWTKDLLAAYFPEGIRLRYADRLQDHPLAREIAVTVICNKVIDQAGGAFLLFGEGLVPALLVKTVGLYLAFDQILEGARWRESVRALDGSLETNHQYEYLLQLENALAFLCRWSLQRGLRLLPEKETIAEWRANLQEYLAYLGESADFSVLSLNAPDASRQLFFNRLRDFPILVELSKASNETVQAAAQVFDWVVDFLGLRQIATLLAEVKARDPWEQRLQSALEDRYRAAAARIALMQLRARSRESTGFFQQSGVEDRLAKLERLRAELSNATSPTLAPFATFGAELDSLVDACGGMAGFG